MDKVLIIEDEEEISRLERDYLEMNGFHVEIEISGESGLIKAVEEQYDVLILDVNLPGENGFEICRKIRMTKDIPIMFVTAKVDGVDIIRGLGLGADDYLVKPFDPMELVARVKAHLSRYRSLKKKADRLRKTEISIRNLHIDTSAREVYLNGKPVPLTTKEYELLLFLCRHPNQVMTKEQIIRTIWGYEFSGDFTTVSVHISKLREKIETDASKPQYIETKWGVGYRLKA